MIPLDTFIPGHVVKELIKPMLRVTVEYLPHGHADKAEVIGDIQIINDLLNDRRPEFGDYDVTLREIKKGNIIKFEHKDHDRSQGVWRLIGRILEQLWLERDNLGYEPKDLHPRLSHDDMMYELLKDLSED